VRLLTIDPIRDFLAAIASHVCNPDPRTAEYFQAGVSIDRALTGVLWTAQMVPRYKIADENLNFGELELQFNGCALWYFDRREGLRDQPARP
jgi:hypothetical protein